MWQRMYNTHCWQQGVAPLPLNRRARDVVPSSANGASEGYVKYLFRKQYQSNEDESQTEMVDMSVAPSTLPHGNEAYTPRLRRVLNPLDARNVQYLEEVELPEGVLNNGRHAGSNGAAGGEDAGDVSTALVGRRQELMQLKHLLDQKDGELETAKLTIREREQELAIVREEMARQEGQLRVAKSELIETRMQVQEKDSQLKAAYEALTVASRERSKLRQALIETEQEVQTNRSHMQHFYSGLAEIHDVMGELEVEVNDLMGEEEDGSGEEAEISLLGYSMKPPSQDEEEAATVEVLRELSDLSNTISRDAQDDLATYYQQCGQDPLQVYRNKPQPQ